jgi:hypothetical protein
VSVGCSSGRIVAIGNEASGWGAGRKRLNKLNTSRGVSA